MGRTSRSVQFGGILALLVATSAIAGAEGVSKDVTLDQGIDAATLQRYHHTDQGSRLAPVPWLLALEKADGSGKFMSDENLHRYGFITDGSSVSEGNPYGWPVGFTVSDPSMSGGIASGGITCAACHTGQIQYKGAAVRIEGGAGMHDVDNFFIDLSKAFAAATSDPSRRAQFIANAIEAGYPADRMDADFTAASAGFTAMASAPEGMNSTKSGRGRSDAMGGAGNRTFGSLLREPANMKPLTAPVSVPYLWDIWRLSWVQTNGFQPGGLTLSRNLGEVLAVLATTNVFDAKTGELNPEPLRWQTSAQLDGLVWMEKTLQGLRAPVWPADILGPVDQAKADRGKQLFTSTCAGCHGIKELPTGVWDISSVPLKKIGTDPLMATNYARYTYDGSKLGLSKDITSAEGLPVVINAALRQLYADNNTPAAEQEPSLYQVAPCGYKARPLIGTWATAPFLHNGSVRTIFQLLSDTRQDSFVIGSREYDPVNLGYTEEEDNGLSPFVLDTSISGNSNKGHWFTDQVTRPGRIGSKLSDADKYAIIEFLKAATYDNYPTEKREKEAPFACQDNANWAKEQ